MSCRRKLSPEQRERYNASKRKYDQNPINKKRKKEYVQQNKADISKKQSEYYQRNKDKIIKRVKKYAEEHKDEISIRLKEYQKKNAEKIRTMQRNRSRKNSELGLCKAHPSQKAVAKGKCVYCNIRSRITNSYSTKLRRKGAMKNTRTLKATGCTVQELYYYLESLFQPGMTWENMGEWHIDHIVPLALAKNEEELVSLCHYTNLQPLWAKDNIAKRSLYDGKYIKAFYK